MKTTLRFIIAVFLSATIAFAQPTPPANSSVTANTSTGLLVSPTTFFSNATNITSIGDSLPATGTGNFVRATNPTITTPTIATITAPATTNLTLSGGSSGASLALGQGATAGGLTFTATGTGRAALYGSNTTGHNLLLQNANVAGYSAISFNSSAASETAIIGWANASAGVSPSSLLITTAGASPIAFGTAVTERMRLASSGNLLIGGTTDITGTGGLKAFGITAATNTTSGAFQLGNNVGLSGNSGGPSYFGGSGTFGTANTANNGVGSYGASPAAGNFGFTSGSITGTNMYGFTDQTATYTLNGAATEVIDFRAYATLALGTNALTNWYGFQSTLNSKTGAGVLTNAYAYYASSPTAATNNYAFFSAGTAPSVLGGNATIGAAASFPTLTFGANSSQIITTSASGLAYWDIASSAGGWNFRNTFNGSNVFTFGGTGNFTAVGNGAFGPAFTPNPWGTGGQLDVNGTTGGILGVAYAGTAKGYVLAEAGGILVNSHAGGTAKFNTSGSGATTIGNSAGVTFPTGVVAVSGTTEANLILNATSSTAGLRVWNIQSASDSFKLRLLGDAFTPVLLTPLVISSTGAATFTGSITSTSTGRNTFAGAIISTGVNPSALASSSILDQSSGTARLISYGPNALTPGAFTLFGLSSDGTAGAARFQISTLGQAALASTSFLNTASWRTGSLAIGPDGQDKVVIGPLISTTNGPTIGGHQTGLGGWAPINVNGSTVTLRIGETAALSINASNNVSIPVGDLTVTNSIGITSGNITESVTNGTATWYANYNGYQQSNTQFRNFGIYDGKRAEIAMFTGSTKAATFAGVVSTTNTTLATNTTSGALVVGGGVGVGGSIYSGGSINGTGSFNLTGPAATGRSFNIQTAGVNRWALYADNTAESGGDAGSNLNFSAYTDAGVLTGRGMSLNRATGAATFTGDVALSTAGKTVSVKSGTNALAGTVTLASGAATITSSAIDVNTVIVMSVKTLSGTVGDHLPSVQVFAGSAVIDGSPSDNSTYNWVALKVN